MCWMWFKKKQNTHTRENVKEMKNKYKTHTGTHLQFLKKLNQHLVNNKQGYKNSGLKGWLNVIVVWKFLIKLLWICFELKEEKI